MLVSVRRTFRQGDAGWDDFLRCIGVPGLREVRSLDSALNRQVDDRGSRHVDSLDEVRTVVAALPSIDGDHAFTLLAVEAERVAVPDRTSWLRLLGHDLSDETQTSSLLNCGPWTGALADFVPKLNPYGLLSFDDAADAKALLPTAWPGDPHARVTIWALYEVLPQGH